MAAFTDKWRKAYAALSDTDRGFVDGIVDTNAFDVSVWYDHSAAVRKVLEFYMIERDHIPHVERTARNRRIKVFEKSCPAEISEECQRLLDGCGERGL